MADGLLWHERQERLTGQELADLQLTKLKKQLQYEYGASPYLKKRLDDAGVVPQTVQSPEDLARIPLFTKDENRKLQELSLDQEGHPYGLHMCAPLAKVACVSATSGTTGLPTFYTFTRKDLDINGEVTGRGLWRMDVRPGDSVLLGFALSMFVGGLPLAHAIQQLGARVIPVGAEAGTARFLQFAKLTRPEHMICTPSFAEYLAERAPEHIGCNVQDLGIKTLLCGGESGAGNPEVRRRLENAYGAKIFDMIGGAWGFFACSCLRHQGMHFVSPDYILLELIDSSTKKPIPFRDGAVGELAHTSLEWEGGPALRYDLGDIVQVFTAPCECGMPGLRIKVLGRADDMIIVKGINVYPAAVKNLVAGFAPRTTGSICIILDEPGPKVNPPVRVRVEYGAALGESGLESLRHDLERRISDVLRFRPLIELVPPESLGRTFHKSKLVIKAYEEGEMANSR